MDGPVMKSEGVPLRGCPECNDKRIMVIEYMIGKKVEGRLEIPCPTCTPDEPAE